MIIILRRKIINPLFKYCDVEIVGPYHASAKEAFPAQAGVADRNATHYMGSPGAGVEGAQQWQAVEPTPVNPLDAVGPGKRKVPWAGSTLMSTLISTIVLPTALLCIVMTECTTCWQVL